MFDPSQLERGNPVWREQLLARRFQTSGRMDLAEYEGRGQWRVTPDFRQTLTRVPWRPIMERRRGLSIVGRCRRHQLGRERATERDFRGDLRGAFPRHLRHISSLHISAYDDKACYGGP